MVKISGKSLLQEFDGCDPDFIRNVCKGSCCESSVSKTGTLITIHPTEEVMIKNIGGIVVDNLLQPVNRKCQFKTAENLCSLHFTEYKPFGCSASPFKLNNKDTLIIRNRYRSLKCFKNGRRLPAYKAFQSSLIKIFGIDETQRISGLIEEGILEIYSPIEERIYKILKDNETYKKK